MEEMKVGDRVRIIAHTGYEPFTEGVEIGDLGTIVSIVRNGTSNTYPIYVQLDKPPEGDDQTPFADNELVLAAPTARTHTWKR